MIYQIRKAKICMKRLQKVFNRQKTTQKSVQTRLLKYKIAVMYLSARSSSMQSPISDIDNFQIIVLDVDI